MVRLVVIQNRLDARLGFISLIVPLSLVADANSITTAVWPVRDIFFLLFTEHRLVGNF